MRVVTGIGSRKTPPAILEEMTKLGRYFRANGTYVRSGHAEGADWAFEQGAKKLSVVYLPWGNFNSQLPILGHPVDVSNMPSDRVSKAEAIIRKNHPAPSKLTRGAWALMRRNVCQVLGWYLWDITEAVIFWAPWAGPAVVQGGTNVALQVAIDYKVPLIVNMFDEQFNTAAKVVAALGGSKSPPSDQLLGPSSRDLGF